MIGHLEGETNARKLSDYLSVQGVENQMESEKGNTWAVWIHEEGELERARAMLAEFQANPADPKFQGVDRAAKDLREKKEKEQAAFEKRVQSRRHLFQPVRGYAFGQLTFVLICTSTVIFILTSIGDKGQALSLLLIGNPRNPLTWQGGWAGLADVRHGEVWRLITPIFMHADIMHIFFNMLWLASLGSMIESRQSSFTLALLVLFTGIGSNLAQYFWAGPSFYGMSGVVYGLLGYIWIRGKFDPGSGLFVDRRTVVMMIIWLLLGFTGMLNMANMCHLGGLLLGMAYGYLSSLRYR